MAPMFLLQFFAISEGLTSLLNDLNRRGKSYANEVLASLFSYLKELALGRGSALLPGL